MNNIQKIIAISVIGMLVVRVVEIQRKSRRMKEMKETVDRCNANLKNMADRFKNIKFEIEKA